ncbi:hypothetical protein [Candidatus Poriferisodalis sp.]|uniref:hypothetical protein n=1 Tax=Candidatus Poriferisodalis sp. TaxID=3101277 RepID=UPI003B02D460
MSSRGAGRAAAVLLAASSWLRRVVSPSDLEQLISPWRGLAKAGHWLEWRTAALNPDLAGRLGVIA